MVAFLKKTYKERCGQVFPWGLNSVSHKNGCLGFCFAKTEHQITSDRGHLISLMNLFLCLCYVAEPLKREVYGRGLSYLALRVVIQSTNK